ncbi:MAG: Nif3-like dinuclear metal center hexameric protein [Nitratiruptor sp.]|nr:Nif3-like dinuclear metal center hexameric protein [Nitratiruptor sp.]NPA83751.1 Nif3-like dinuclear metal center hexameric protein [Campylobacterota bacterium]
MRVAEYLQLLDTISPFALQEEWDNSGLQVGHREWEVEGVVVAIDLDRELLEILPPRALLITHHPLLFAPLKRFDLAGYPAGLIAGLLEKRIAHIALHTNFDKSHLNRYVAQKVLGVEEVVCEGLVCSFQRPMDFEEALQWIQQAFKLPYVRYVPPASKEVKDFALTTGSGGGLIGKIDADLFLTGDLKYHDAMRARVLGLGVVDIGHFESEIHFAPALAEELKKKGIEAIIAPVENPLRYKGS